MISRNSFSAFDVLPCRLASAASLIFDWNAWASPALKPLPAAFAESPAALTEAASKCAPASAPMLRSVTSKAAPIVSAYHTRPPTSATTTVCGKPLLR